jgi:hypothetical protein
MGHWVKGQPTESDGRRQVLELGGSTALVRNSAPFWDWIFAQAITSERVAPKKAFSWCASLPAGKKVFF